MGELKRMLDVEKNERDTMQKRAVAPVWEDLRQIQVCDGVW